MKIFKKKYIPTNLRILGSHILRRSFNPFSYKSEIDIPDIVSDLFIWSPDFENIYFIAENLNGLINGKEEKVKHVFHFYSKEGRFLRTYSFISQELFTKIKLPKNISKDKYISFVHFAYSDISLRQNLENIGIGENLKVSKQSRGYTIYSPIESSIGSSAHGNIGGITSNGNKSLKQRSIFIYTPVYQFQKSNIYDLVFNNPTNKHLYIKIYTLKNKILATVILEPMATGFIEIKHYEGGINIESKLPICRPLIFKNSPPLHHGFDVFHG